MRYLNWWVQLNLYYDWFFYFRRGKVRYTVWNEGDAYHAVASNGNITVFNCYGSTLEQAKDIANFRLKQAMIKFENETDIEFIGDGIVVYIRKRF